MSSTVARYGPIALELCRVGVQHGANGLGHSAVAGDVHARTARQLPIWRDRAPSVTSFITMRCWRSASMFTFAQSVVESASSAAHDRCDGGIGVLAGGHRRWRRRIARVRGVVHSASVCARMRCRGGRTRARRVAARRSVFACGSPRVGIATITVAPITADVKLLSLRESCWRPAVYACTIERMISSRSNSKARSVLRRISTSGGAEHCRPRASSAGSTPARRVPRRRSAAGPHGGARGQSAGDPEGGRPRAGRARRESRRHARRGAGVRGGGYPATAVCR